ncbi:GNAT family N-acetyltransferase [Nocardia caishijiensis]|uniref:Ribosomal-protein-alanine N-acetyltransferase n=1 Tax=Nocardia caishijiensis TaxID=184756 RepID=A0ABQ6YIV5_9NOCA|nr:GNAT family protein [Nocardia caishijiensis]KAF0845568.1 ribosomal-protein-alanine N-acetyltransferase [Nocardia caishijiensis]
MSRTITEAPTALSSPTFGPVRHGDSLVRLRPPRLSDFDRWREIRLRDRAWIEPHWGTSPLSWEQRHTPRIWARECLVAWADMRAGRRFVGVIEVDGRFAGQVEYTIIDAEAATAEASAWIDAGAAGRGLIGRALLLLCDHMFRVHRVARVLAPVSIDNDPALRCLRGLGFRHEATMARAYDAGGARKDHTLWALTPADLAAAQLSPLVPADPADVPGVEPRTSTPTYPPSTAPGAGSANSGVPRAVVALAALRWSVWSVREKLRHYRPAAPVALTVRASPNTVVRTLTRTDRAQWTQVGRTRATATSSFPRSGQERLGTGEGSSAGQDRSKSRAQWYRTVWHSRFGLRSPSGLRLVLDVNGTYAGEFHLYDSPLPCQATGLYTWVDPLRVEPELWAVALRSVIEHAVAELGVQRMAAEVPVGDTVTAAVLAAAGFAHEGLLTAHRGPSGLCVDHDLWGLT